MTKSLESLYQQIGETIASVIGEEWSSAWVSIEIAEGVTSFEGGYLSSKEKQKKSFRVNRDLATLLRDLHTSTREAGQAEWNKAVFELFPDGKFRLSYEYPK